MCFPRKYWAAQCCACTNSWQGLLCSLWEDEPQSLWAEQTQPMQGANNLSLFAWVVFCSNFFPPVFCRRQTRHFISWFFWQVGSEEGRKGREKQACSKKRSKRIIFLCKTHGCCSLISRRWKHFPVEGDVCVRVREEWNSIGEKIRYDQETVKTPAI